LFVWQLPALSLTGSRPHLKNLPQMIVGRIQPQRMKKPVLQMQDALSDQIIVSAPLPDQLITSPLIITGEARGTWFFEANFPVTLLDSNENILVLHYAAIEEEWMTEDFISFTATIEFDDPKTATGFLVLDKNNPSDIREYDAQLIIPVRFE